MVERITKGIKISVETKYNGTIYRAHRLHYVFSYFISIENKSTDTIQLLERFWTIYDSLNLPEFVEGKGVVGQTPILLPNSEYNYKSNCVLSSSIGSMKGQYKMINTETNEEFLVDIPTFQLTNSPKLN